MSATGHCLCGAVKFTAEGVEQHIHGCHCSMCRRWSGGPMLAASVESIAFEGEENIKRYDSSEWAQRGFCRECGSSLFYYLKPANRHIVCTGAFDDTASFELAGEIYVDEKPSFYDFAGDHPRQTGAEFMASLNQP